MGGVVVVIASVVVDDCGGSEDMGIAETGADDV